jgi:hypothetical protein
MRKNRSVFAWVLLAAILVATGIASVIELQAGPAPQNLLQVVSRLTTLIGFAVFGSTGALIVARQPRNTVGWLLLLEGSLVFLWPLVRYFENLPAPPAEPSAVFALGLWVANWSWLWLIFPLLMIALHFPTGRPPSPRWNWLRPLAVGLAAFFLLVTALAPEINAPGEPVPWRIPNPIGVVNLEFLLPIWIALLLLLAVSSVASLFVRYRHGSATERSQIKWLLYAGALFLVVWAQGFDLIFGGIAGTDAFSVALNLSILMLPIAIAIAILRYKLYDIDLVIRRTLVYAVVTALLALVFYGSTILLQRLFTGLTGQESPVAIVASTLVIAALFSPLRRRVQDFVDRRFYRRKYDAQQVLAQFGAIARSETDLDALIAAQARAVEETLRPDAIGVWLRETRPAVGRE